MFEQRCFTRRMAVLAGALALLMIPVTVVSAADFRFQEADGREDPQCFRRWTAYLRATDQTLSGPY